VKVSDLFPWITEFHIYYWRGLFEDLVNANFDMLMRSEKEEGEFHGAMRFVITTLDETIANPQLLMRFVRTFLEMEDRPGNHENIVANESSSHFPSPFPLSHEAVRGIAGFEAHSWILESICSTLFQSPHRDRSCSFFAAVVPGILGRLSVRESGSEGTAFE
jgi:hypothetical protein